MLRLWLIATTVSVGIVAAVPVRRQRTTTDAPQRTTTDAPQRPGKGGDGNTRNMGKGLAGSDMLTMGKGSPQRPRFAGKGNPLQVKAPGMGMGARESCNLFNDSNRMLSGPSFV